MREPRIYIASRTHHAKEWQVNRQQMFLNSSWIDEAGAGETKDLGELWQRICHEVSEADALIFYATTDDFPLKGALIEVGMAIALGKPVLAVLPGVELEPRSLRPAGSWLMHPKVTQCVNLPTAVRQIVAAMKDLGKVDTCPWCNTNPHEYVDAEGDNKIECCNADCPVNPEVSGTGKQQARDRWNNRAQQQ